MNYQEFLELKSQYSGGDGFDPVFMPDFLFPFQQDVTTWGIRRGRSAFFEDCGLGKTPQQLVWAENIVRKMNARVLILTPLAVSAQTIREGEKFGIEVRRSQDGKPLNGITVTNYERLSMFNPSDYAGVVCDESSILKNFSGVRKREITEFMKKMRFRLLCTATASPNDYIELGTSSEALGDLGYMDMLGMFFKNDQNTCKPVLYRHGGQSFEVLQDKAKWRFKKHAQADFWKWVTSWARAIRRPSDLGYADDGFVLPPLIETEHILKVSRPLNGRLFAEPAIGLSEQREERRNTLVERCEEVARLVDHGNQALVWCQLNDEGDLLEKLIPGAVQVEGSDTDDHKEKAFLDFAAGNIRVLVTKPKIGAFGLNFQNCAHVTFFPSHSFEQYYQGVRRCWRFGQKNTVRVDVVSTEGEVSVLKNLQRKADQADKMFSELVRYMNDSHKVKMTEFRKEMEAPAWL